MSQIIFVYGTLKNGHKRQNLLQDQRLLGTAYTPPEYKMYQYGGYPALVKEEHGGTNVYGELYEVTDSCIIELDKAEGVATGLFSRKEIKLENLNLFRLPLYKESSLKLFSNFAFCYFFVNTERLSKGRDCGNNWTID